MDKGDNLLILMILVASLVVATDIFRNNLGVWFSKNGVWIIVSVFVVVLLVASFYFRFWRPMKREGEEENSEEKKNGPTNVKNLQESKRKIKINPINPEIASLNNQKTPSTQQTEETNNKRLLSPKAGTAKSFPTM